MDAARAAVQEFMAKAGHHDTIVHERVAPAIYHETITREDHEDTVTVTDREIHQDHYHFSLQPVEDEEILEDKVDFNMLPVDERKFEHGDPADVDRVVADEAAKYKTEIIRIEGKKTSSTTAPLVGEHIHHHVHETIQPIINKRTLEPHVIHTTIPIHEVHHNAAIFHATSSLPVLSMADFKRQGGVLNGREERLDSFEGEPRAVGKAIGGTSDNQPGSSAAPAAPAAPAPAATATNPTSGDAAPAPGPSSAAKPSMPDRVTPTKDADVDGKKTTDSVFDSQRASLPTAPAPTAAPPAPPLPPPHPTTALSTVGHPAIRPTYLGPHLYARAHPAGITGARRVPTMAPQQPGQDKDKPLPERP